MAEEIVQTFQIARHPINNARGSFTYLNQTTNVWVPFGRPFYSGEEAEYLLYLPQISSQIHATTPNAKLRIQWTTTVSGTNAVKFYPRLLDIVRNDNTYSLDPAAADFTANLSSSVTDSSLGASKHMDCDLTIPDAVAVGGRPLIGTLRRDDADAADTLAGTIIVLSVLFIADKA